MRPASSDHSQSRGTDDDIMMTDMISGNAHIYTDGGGNGSVGLGDGDDESVTSTGIIDNCQSPWYIMCMLLHMNILPIQIEE